MLNFLRRAVSGRTDEKNDFGGRTDEQIKLDFGDAHVDLFSGNAYVCDRPSRCGACNHFQLAGSNMVFVPDSCTFFWGTDTYETLVKATKQSAERTAVCFACIKALP